MRKYGQGFEAFTGSTNNQPNEVPKFNSEKPSSKNSNDDEYIDFEELK